MLIFRMARTELEHVPDDLDGCLRGAGEDCRALIREARATQAEILGLESKQLGRLRRELAYGATEPLYAEILKMSSGIVALEIINPTSDSFLVTEDGELRPAAGQGRTLMTLYAVGQPEISDGLRRISDMLEARLDVEFRSHHYDSESFKKLVEAGLETAQPPTDTERVGANVLTDAVARRAAIAIASSGGLLREQMPKQLKTSSDEEVERVLSSLQTAGVIESDLVVICSRSSTQIVRVPNRRALEAASEAGMRCACGKSVMDEGAQDALSLSALGRKLLNGSWWMTVVLMDKLHSLGVEYGSMIVEQAKDGDEMDCFVDVSGELVLFELKDKEFNLGNAYSFGAKMGIHRPDHAVVVTTSYVGNDAKEHFKLSEAASRQDRYTYSRVQSPSRVRYMEGMDGLSVDLETLVDEIYAQDASRVLQRLLGFATPSADAVVEGLGRRLSLPSPASG